jgi:amino acid permease
MSMLGLITTTYLVLTVIFMFFLDRELVPFPMDNFRSAKYIDMDFNRTLSVLPYIFFAFTYQQSVPMIYREMANRTYNKMYMVLLVGSSITSLLYILMIIFGYLSLVDQPEMLKILHSKHNILQLHYDSIFFYFGSFGIIITIFAVAPVYAILSKDIIARNLYEEETTGVQNFGLAILICFTSYICAICLPGISEAIIILGCTAYPLTGFILPIIFYLKIFPDASTLNLI